MTADQSPAELQRTTVRVLLASNVLGGVAVASGFAVAGLLAENISGSTSLAGLVATSTTLGAAILAVPLARLARSRGRRVSLTVGYLIATTGAVLSIVAAQVDSLALLLCAGCLFGSGSASNLQSRYAATDAADPARVARSLSLVVWATTIGVVVGPNLTGVGGSLGTSLGVMALAGPYLFSVVAFGLGLATVWIGLRRLQQATPRAKVERQPLAPTFRRVLAIPHARLGLLAIAVAHAVMVGVMSMTSIHLRPHRCRPGTARPRLVRLPGRGLHSALPLRPGRYPDVSARPVRPHHGRARLHLRHRRRPDPRPPRLPLARRTVRPATDPRRSARRHHDQSAAGGN